MAAQRVRRASIELALQVATILWPDFVQIGGLVFIDRPGCFPPRRHVQLRPDLGLDRTGTEAFYSHLHLLDLFTHDRAVSRRTTYDRTHPHFKLAERLGAIAAEAWFTKLQRDFPGQDFRVYYTRYDDPIIRFHRIYPDEVVWFDAPRPRARKLGVFVWDTRPANQRLQPTAPRAI